MRYLLWICLPFFAFGGTKAYSPNIPGQPLIFHTTTPSLTPIQKALLENLSTCQRYKFVGLSHVSLTLAELYMGLADVVFVPLDLTQKQSVAVLYNFNIANSITRIGKLFVSANGKNANEIAQLIKQTLSNFTKIALQLMDDAVQGNSQQFHLDYQKMQTEVIDPFVSAIDTLSTNSALIAEAESSLEGLVSSFSLFLANNNSTVNHEQPVSTSTVLARQQVNKYLIAFIERTFGLEIL